MKTKRKCILTYARSWIALAATRCLGKHGIYVITGDTTRGGAANFSRYSKEQFVYPDPGTDPDGFVERLVRLAEIHAGPDTDLVLMPMYTDLYPVLCREDRFKGLAKIALPPKDAYELVRDKARVANFCGELGIPIPKTVTPADADEFCEAAHGIKYPAFVKIPSGSGAVGTRKVSGHGEAVKTFRDMVTRYGISPPGPFPILQEFAGGEDYCSAFIFDHGEYRASMTYRNMVDFPRGAGVGALRETVDAGVLEETGRKLLERLRWNGVAQIDYRWDGAGEPRLIEVNPRFWGGLAQSIASGWEFPLWVYDLALRGHIGEVHPAKRDVRTTNSALMALRVLEEIFAPAVSSGPAGRIKAATELIKKSRGALNEYFSWDDPLPVLGLAYPVMVLLKYGTVTQELVIGERGTHKDGP